MAETRQDKLHSLLFQYRYILFVLNVGKPGMAWDAWLLRFDEAKKGLFDRWVRELCKIGKIELDMEYWVNDLQSCLNRLPPAEIAERAICGRCRRNQSLIIRRFYR